MSKQKQVTGQVPEVTGWTGWVIFASFWLGVAAIFQMIAGLTAILQENVFVVTENRLVLLDYQQWGWTHFVLGLILLPAAFALASGRLWGRILGVIVATLSLIGNFVFLQAYPWWCATIIIIDFLVIYAIIMHGDELRTD